MRDVQRMHSSSSRSRRRADSRSPGPQSTTPSSSRSRPNPFSILTHWAAHTQDHQARHGRGRGAILASDPGGRRGGARRRGEQWATGVRHRPRRLPVRIRPHGRRHAAGARRRVHARDAASGERVVAGRLRARGRILVVSVRDLGAEDHCRSRIRQSGWRRAISNLRLGDQAGRRTSRATPLSRPTAEVEDPRRAIRGGRSGQSGQSRARVS